MAEQEQFVEQKKKMAEVEKIETENNQMDNVFVKATGETLTNMQAIESCRHEQNRDIIDNLRLGSYDRFGNYIIIPAIREELLIIPKIVYVKQVQQEKVIYDMKSAIPLFGDIFFKLVATESEVTLYLVETVRREAGDYVEVYEEILDNFAMTEDDYIPLSVIFRNYNILENDDDDKGRKMPFDFEFMNILTRKIYLSLLSRELTNIAQFDDKEAFDEMVAILKNSGEYGERVFEVFESRLKDRPEIYELSTSKEYNKALLEILLSSLDIATTQADKENFETREIYFKLLGVRNRNIDKYLSQANEEIDEQYVSQIVARATKHFLQNEDEEDKILLEFLDKISPSKMRKGKRTLEKPILKQGMAERKEAERLALLALTTQDKKEEVIKQILTAKKDEKSKSSTPANKKLKPAKKVAKKTAKKGKGKAKPKGKGKAKPKVKSKKAVKKPKNVKKAVKKVGKKLKPKKKTTKKASAKKGKVKNNSKKKSYEVSFSRTFLEKYRTLSLQSKQATSQVAKAKQTSQVKTIVETIKKEKIQTQPQKTAQQQKPVTPQSQKPEEFGFQIQTEKSKNNPPSEFVDELFISRKNFLNAEQSNLNPFAFSNEENSDEIKNIRKSEEKEFVDVKEQIIREQLKKKQQESTNYSDFTSQPVEPNVAQSDTSQPSQPPKTPQDEQFFH